MEFTKIKYDQKLLSLVWHTGNNNGTLTEHKMKSSEKPLPELTRALDAFLEPAEVLLRIRSADTDRELYFDDVRGISIAWEKEDGDDYQSIIITLAKQITVNAEPAELIVNMPKMRLSHRMQQLLDDLERYATKFIRGARSQHELFSVEDTTGEPDIAPLSTAALERDEAKLANAEQKLREAGDSIAQIAVHGEGPIADSVRAAVKKHTGIAVEKPSKKKSETFATADAPAPAKRSHKKKPAALPESIDATVKVTGASPEMTQAIEKSAERAGFTVIK